MIESGIRAGWQPVAYNRGVALSVIVSVKRKSSTFGLD